MGDEWKGPLRQVGECRWEIPVSYKKAMRTSGLIYASPEMVKDILSDQAPEQVANVACLPGVVGLSLAMPDIHWGYGFPIGGVAAFDAEEGIISPGGVGYDINCGMRLLRSDLTLDDVAPRLNDLMDDLAKTVPAGVGSEGPSSCREATSPTSWSGERLGPRNAATGGPRMWPAWRSAAPWPEPTPPR